MFLTAKQAVKKGYYFTRLRFSSLRIESYLILTLFDVGRRDNHLSICSRMVILDLRILKIAHIYRQFRLINDGRS
jgi:hypothetical protein